MAKTTDICGAVGPLAVTDRDLDYSQVQFRGAEDQVEIAKRIEITEETPP